MKMSHQECTKYQNSQKYQHKGVINPENTQITHNERTKCRSYTNEPQRSDTSDYTCLDLTRRV